MTHIDLTTRPFDDHFVRHLPADPSTRPGVRQVHEAIYSLVQPTPVAAPRLLGWSDSLAAELGIARPAPDSPALLALAGNTVLPGMRPYAACYGGHQFGHWAGQLGDGRAINLGEWLTTDGKRYELQLKGAGPTPYSRRADGRAVLRSSLREFLCSEAMHHLGIPTSRALSLVASGDTVIRDMFYDGHPEAEPGAIVCRVAPSFVRFGHFEIHASRADTALVKHLADYVITTQFPELGTEFGTLGPAVYAHWFTRICQRTARLVAHWMRVGFVHGVLNTDNMSILGLTIDYGPYGWLDGYEPGWTPNTTDAEGRRYCFANQPQIAHWNLARLAQAIAPLVDDAAALDAGLAAYSETFNATHSEHLAAKLGLARLARPGHPDDSALISELFALLQRQETDYTVFFRRLADVDLSATEPARSAPLMAAYYAPINAETQHALDGWLTRYHARVLSDPSDPTTRRARMNRANPAFILRNYLAVGAIEAASRGDTGELEKLLHALQNPYTETDTYKLQCRPEWARHKAGCSALSCSS
ncbi:MAG: YdiU family protein [Betaproteobacteria bacterium]|nr:MAG: YdiU family protein [Betaproteobacteria bacterium]